MQPARHTSGCAVVSDSSDTPWGFAAQHELRVGDDLGGRALANVSTKLLSLRTWSSGPFRMAEGFDAVGFMGPGSGETFADQGQRDAR